MIKFICLTLLSINLFSYPSGSEQDKPLVSFFHIRRQSLQYHRRMIERHRRLIIRNEPLGAIPKTEETIILQLQLHSLKKQRVEEIRRQVSAIGLELRNPQQRSRLRRIYQV